MTMPQIATEITTILGKGSAFDGKLTFEGAVRIDGEFSGEIRTQGMLVIGESAQVRANVQAATIVIEGVVRGDLVATASIQIHAPARVHGNLSTPSLEIEKGSVFEGNCQMGTGQGTGQAVVPGQGQGLSVAEAPRKPVAVADT